MKMLFTNYQTSGRGGGGGNSGKKILKFLFWDNVGWQELPDKHAVLAQDEKRAEGNPV